jgi:hypothetical protein
MHQKPLFPIVLMFASSLFFSSCGKQAAPVSFSDESAPEEPTPYISQLSQDTINISQTYNLNQEFKVAFVTYDPSGTGNATFKARSLKSVNEAGGAAAEEGKKLVLVEISVKGDKNNHGQPSGFNQIGQTPSPQFVLIDKNSNKTYAEETYYSDAYTKSKKLFELTGITLDHEQWVHTALVFQIDQGQTPDLALRFTNPSGQIEYYDIKE